MDSIKKKSDGTFEHGTLEEAERRQAEAVKKRKMTLCPLMRATCSADCVCYLLPVVKEIGSKDRPFWECIGGYCNCYMLMGPD